jgi:hypothetical protein
VEEAHGILQGGLLARVITGAGTRLAGCSAAAFCGFTRSEVGGVGGALAARSLLGIA